MPWYPTSDEPYVTFQNMRIPTALKAEWRREIERSQQYVGLYEEFGGNLITPQRRNLGAARRMPRTFRPGIPGVPEIGGE